MHVSGSMQTNPEYYSDGAINIVHVIIEFVTMSSGFPKEYLFLSIQGHPGLWDLSKKNTKRTQKNNMCGRKWPNA